MHTHDVPHLVSSPIGWPPKDMTTRSVLVHILSVGRIESSSLIREGFFDDAEMRISFAEDYRDLWISSKYEQVHLVLLHNSLCSFELEEAARLVRVRWPNARILIIRSGDLSLDDALYDDRLTPHLSPSHLFAAISRLLAYWKEGDSRDGER